MLDINDHEIICGSLLSDGCITKIPKCKNYYYVHTCKHIEYLHFLKDELTLETKIIPYKAKQYHANDGRREYSGWGSAGGQLKSGVHEFLTQLRQKWYPGGKKIIPDDLLLTPRIVLHWFLGDGTNRFNEGVRLCTDAFPHKDAERLSEQLRVWVPECEVGERNRIHIPQSSAFEFFQYIGTPPPLECFAYKFETSAVKSYHNRLCELCGTTYKARQCNQRVCNSICGSKLWKKENQRG